MQSIIIRWGDFIRIKIYRPITVTLIMCIPGKEYKDTLSSIAMVALIYKPGGRWKEAEKLEVQVMETGARVLGPEHPDTLISMANLASTF